MRIFKTENGAIVISESECYAFDNLDWDAFINQKGLYAILKRKIAGLSPMDDFDAERHSIAPIKNQEIWASGVTYMRSKEARMEESKDAGGGTFYDKVCKISKF